MHNGIVKILRPLILCLLLWAISSIAWAQISVCVVRADSIPVLNNDIKICVGGSVTLVARACKVTGATETYSFRWTNINEPIISVTNSKFLIQDEGAYEIQIKGRSSGYTATDTIYVRYEAKQNLSIFPRTLVKCLNDKLTIKAFTPGFKDYRWRLLGSNVIINNTDSLVNPLAGREYVVSATSINGCRVDSNLFVVKAPDIFEPKVNLGPKDTALCAGQPLRLRNLLGNKSSHFWSTGSTDTVAIVTKPGKYWLKVKTEVCSSSDSITLFNAPSPVINKNISKVSSCYGSGAKLKIDIQGDTNTFSYQWSPANGLSNDKVKSPIAKPTSSTLYKLKVSAVGGCYDTTSILVSINPKININLLGKDTLLCGGDSIKLTSSVNGGSPSNVLPYKYLYKWSPSISLSDAQIPSPWASPRETTTYKLIVTDYVNCADSALIGVKVFNLKVDILPWLSSNVCIQDTLEIEAKIQSNSSNYDLQWLSNSDNKILQQNGLKSKIVFSKIGNYSLEAIASDPSGCKVKSNLNYQVRNLPSINITEVYRRLCFGDTAKILATAQGGSGINYRFNWFPKNNSISNDTLSRATFVGKQEVVGKRKYFATVSDSYKCTSTKDSIEIETIPFFVADLGSRDTSACEGTSVKLAPIKPIPPSFTYRWVNQTTGTTLSKDTFILVNQTGLYELQVEDAQSGCSNRVLKQVLFINIPSKPLLSLQSPICSTDTLILQVDTDTTNKIKWKSSGKGILKFDQSEKALYQPSQEEKGMINFNLTLSNKCGIAQADTSVEILESPKLQLQASATEIYVDSLIYLKDLSNINETLTWDFGDSSSTQSGKEVSYLYTLPNLYVIKVKSSKLNNLCAASDSIVIKVISKEILSEIFLPNVFSPLSSFSENQSFRLFGKNISSEEFMMEVYNRWGQIVFQTNILNEAIQEGWNGKGNAHQISEQGTYAYIVKGKFLNGDKFEKSGSVMLIK